MDRANRVCRLTRLGGCGSVAGRMLTSLPSGHLIAGRYRVETPLGAGGFGQVYRATQLELDRSVALKVLAGAALASPEQVARFRREATLAQRLEHPNTVRLLDHGVCVDVGPYIVMELLKGESLAALLAREGAQHDARTLRLAQHVLKALMEAHELGVVHRDIKPGNIFITSHAGEPFFARLLDFGIAKQLSEATSPASRRLVVPGPFGRAGSDSGGLTAPSHVMGTPRYMAPEQGRGDPIGPATDLYALGLTLAEMVGGRPVLEMEDVAAVVAAQLSDEPLVLSSAVEGSAFGPLIRRAIAKRPSDRFASAAAMLDAVNAIRLPGGARTVPPALDGAEHDAVAFAPTIETPLASQRGAPRRRPRALVLGVAGVALAFGGAYLAWRGTEDQQSRASVEGSASPAAASQERAAGPMITAISSSHGDVTVLVGAYPERGFERDPRRWSSIPAIAFAEMQSAILSREFRVVSSNTHVSNGRVGAILVAQRGDCTAQINYDETPSVENARELAERVGERDEWSSPIVVDGHRVLSLVAKAPTQTSARACTEELWNAVFGPPDTTPRGAPR